MTVNFGTGTTPPGTHADPGSLAAVPSQDASDYYDQSAYEQAMDEWVALFASRDELAQEYATCLRDFPTDWDRWPDFNAAILRRWSPAGLEYIKTQAWKIARFTDA